MVISLQSLNLFHNTLIDHPCELNLECFRNQIRTCQIVISNPKSLLHIQNDTEVSSVIVKICDSLMMRLESGFDNIDVQFLCATTLFNHINILSDCNKLKYVEYVHSYLSEYSKRKEQILCNWKRATGQQNEETLLNEVVPMSFINGFFHTIVSGNEDDKLIALYENIMTVSLNIVLKSCMIYSTTTFTSFRNLNAILKKITEWNVLHKISGEVRGSILYVILYNWENPLVGIKDHNLDMFINYINMCDNQEELMIDILKFPWNKAKYFSLCAVIPSLKYKNVPWTRYHDSLLKGLKYSIKNNYLVSAGSDMYKILLQCTDLFNHWYDLFFDMFLDVLISENHSVRSNLLNHWFPPTVRKYPLLISVFVNSFLEIPLSENAEHSFVTILKFGRKFGLVLVDWDNEPVILKNHAKACLKHVNEEIRLQAIQVICNSSKNNSVPSSDEFLLVKDFFNYNSNYDSTAFRQNIVNSFTVFLIRVRDSFLCVSKQYDMEKYQPSLESYKIDLESFFVWFYVFVSENLHSTVNYQRKIISLQMLDTVLKYLFSGYLNKNIEFGSCRKSNQRYQGWKLVEYLKSKKKWYFEDKKFVNTLVDSIYNATNDIRDVSVNILIQYYLDNGNLIKKRNDMFVTGLILCNSRKFYEAESGSVVFKLISKMNVDCDINVLRDSDDSQMDVLKYLIIKSEKQFGFHKEDMLYSIYNNQPLYGQLSAINLYLQNSKKSADSTTISDLISFIHSITIHLLEVLSIKSEDGNRHPPSFSEMSESVEYIISISKCESFNYDTNDLQLSDAHQMVLNIIWLNMKTCCELASTIVATHFNALQEKEVHMCLDLNVQVLTRCRHKGAIESAGVSLGQSIKFLTGLKKGIYNKYISEMLEGFLYEVTNEDDSGRSVTRRSAGLTILVHRIVTNDSQEKKPLFYVAMKTLLKILTRHEDVEKSENESDCNAGEKDLPLATALHLLCRTVSESSLSSHVMQYASQLLIESFKHFASEHWQVRNAALQLYGALVPKLIGQKNKSDGDVTINLTMTPDELFSHIPEAWEHIIKHLRSSYSMKSPQEIFSTHSNLVPVLGLLSNMAKRYTLSQFENYPSISTVYTADIEELFLYLVNLLSSPIHTVRNMTAKIIKSFYTVDTFYDHWKFGKPSLKSENKLHGYLLVLKYYTKYYRCTKPYASEEDSDNVIIKLDDIHKEMSDRISKASFESKLIHLEISKDLKQPCEPNSGKNAIRALQAMNKINDNKKLCNGIYSWLNFKIRRSIEMCDENELCDVVQEILNYSDVSIDTLLEPLKNRVKINLPYAPSVLRRLIEILLSIVTEINKNFYRDIFEILYVISIYIPHENLNDLDKNLFIRIFSLLIGDDKSYNYGYLLPLICIIFSKNRICSVADLKPILEVSDIIKTYSDCNNFNADVRHMCAISVKHLAEIVSMIKIDGSNENTGLRIKSNVLSTIVWLLQDEEYHVRQECAKALLPGEKTPRHPTYKLRRIINERFLEAYFEKSTSSISEFLGSIMRECLTHNENKNNAFNAQGLFYNQSNNAYWELELLRQTITNLSASMKISIETKNYS